MFMWSSAHVLTWELHDVGSYGMLCSGICDPRSPRTARRRAGDLARICPYPDVAAAGLEKVKTALKAQAASTSPA
jgi:hypothetical protein